MWKVASVLSLILILWTACSSERVVRPTDSWRDSTSSEPTLVEPVPTPSPTSLAFQSLALGTAPNGYPIIVQVIQTDPWTNKMRVLRGTSAYWLPTVLDLKNIYECQTKSSDYSNFGPYFPWMIRLIDLDEDDEPEVAALWEQAGSAGHKSFHLYRWNGDTYQLICEFGAAQLQVEYANLAADQRPAVILRYNVGPPQLGIPWVDVYKLLSGKFISMNEQYPQFYRELLAKYEQVLPQYEFMADKGFSEALIELKRRIEMATKIVSR